MNTTRPMNHQNDFTACRIDISNDLVDQLSHDPLPQSDIRSRIAPDHFEICRQRTEVCGTRRCRSGGFCDVFLDRRLQLCRAYKRTIPTNLKFARDKPIGRVRGVVLTKGLVRRVTRRLEVALERLQDFLVALRLLPICFQRRVDRPRFEYTEQFVLDCIVHANAAERDTWRLATVEPTTKACVTRSIVILAGVIDHHLPTATSTAHQPRKKRCAALGRARLIRSRQIACQPLADRLPTPPLSITLV